MKKQPSVFKSRLPSIKRTLAWSSIQVFVNGLGRTLLSAMILGFLFLPSTGHTKVDGLFLDSGLEEEAAQWGVYTEVYQPGIPAPTWEMENVSTPSLDGKSLRCAMTGGVKYSNVHCYRNLAADHNSNHFVMSMSFYYQPSSTFNNVGGSSIVQAIEFTMSDWKQGMRYEWALQWDNVDSGAPKWRYWGRENPDTATEPPLTWLDLGIAGPLSGEDWHTLILEGEILAEQVHYLSFTIDEQAYPMDITVEPAIATGVPDKLAIGVQLDGNDWNGTGSLSPYEIFLDQVSFAHESDQLPSYNLIWDDEFSGSSMDAKNWNLDVGNGATGWGNHELQYYTNGQNVTVTGGELTITAKKENTSDLCWYNNGTCQYTSARLTTKEKREFQYGKIKARIKLPVGNGLWPAFWALGSNYPGTAWPKSGESDIMEHKNTDNFTYGALHWYDDVNAHGADYSCPPYGSTIPTIDPTQYHVYDIEWNETYIRWHVDGIQTCEVYIQNGAGSTEEFHKPFFLLLNLAVGGDWPGVPVDDNVLPASMYVDYVRVYCSGIHISIGGLTHDCNNLAAGKSARQSYENVNQGPVELTYTNDIPMIASQRVIYGGVSYSEMMGLPAEQLGKEYVFPYYNNVAMNSQLRVSNVGGADTTIQVYLGSSPDPIDSYSLAAGGTTRKNYSNRNSGPLRVTSSASNILTTIRVLYGGLSYSEMMGYPVSQLGKEYVFPYYNNVAMNSQLRVSNVGGADTTIQVYLGSNPDPIDSYSLAAGGATRKNYTNRNSGPLRVVSTASDILTSVRVLYGSSSYSEMIGYPAGQLGQEYWYPVYDNSLLNSQLRVSNVGSDVTTITVYAGSKQIDSYTLAAGGATRKNYAYNTGPLHVVSSTQPVLTTVRLLYSGNSYYEMMGLPDSQLSTQYYFPWYNNSAMNSELRFAVP
jgi:beta-glucanase (GH16 family)